MRGKISDKLSDAIVFLDRDGVVNRKLPEDHFVRHWADFQFLPGSPEAIVLLNSRNIRVVLVTNQRGVSLGLYSEVDLQVLHARMTSALSSFGARLHAIYYCPHSKGHCMCRKPGTALFEQAFRDFTGTSRAQSVVVGDSFSDLQAAHILGCKKVLISAEPATVIKRATEQDITIEFVSDSLLHAVREYILPSFASAVEATE